MLSASHHVAFWLISWSAAAEYRLVPLILSHYCPELHLPSYSALILFVPSAAYAISFIRKGPPLEPLRTPLPLETEYAFFTWYLVVSLGWFVEFIHLPSIPVDSEGIEWVRSFIHALLAFVVLGTLEPIRQNRTDMQLFAGLLLPGFTPPSIRRDMFGGRSHLWHNYTHLFIIAIMSGIICILNFCLGNLFGPQVSCWTVIRPQLAGGYRAEYYLNLNATYIAFIPLLDLAETIYCAIHKPFWPHWVRDPEILVLWYEPWTFSRDIMWILTLKVVVQVSAFGVTIFDFADWMGW